MELRHEYLLGSFYALVGAGGWCAHWLGRCIDGGAARAYCGYQWHRRQFAANRHLGLGQTVGLAFVLGMVAAPILWQWFAPLPAMEMPSNPWVIGLAGLLVGFGTRLGSGCTSGHGVCGLSRLSLRSLAATLMFMATGVLTVFVVRHVLA